MSKEKTKVYLYTRVSTAMQIWRTMESISLQGKMERTHCSMLP